MITESRDVDELEQSNDEKTHPWRICPAGSHYVKTHSERIHPSKKHPNGEVIARKAHCAKNPSHKDTLSYDELHAIAKQNFSDLSGSPTSGVLDFDNADDYDQIIRGWVTYWNDIFQLPAPLNPNVIKALIATESSFIADKKTPANDNGHARGLMQLIDPTLNALSSHKSELRDYLVPLTHKQAFDPSANVCAGIRWLFWKKITAAHKLSREATWEEAIAEYKGLLKHIIDKTNLDPKEMQYFRKYYQLLSKDNQ